MAGHSSESAPIFVLSHERSGSTLVRFILDTHPAITAPDELSLGRLCFFLWNVVEVTVESSVSDEPNAVPLRVKGFNRARFSINPSEAACKAIRDIVNGLMEPRLRREGKHIWCDKSPQNVGYVELLCRVFPNARFICLYRSCLDVAASLLRIMRYQILPDMMEQVQQSPQNLVQAGALSWLRKNELLLAFEEAHAQVCHRLVYESLVSDPRASLAGLFGFLGLPFEEKLIDEVFAKKRLTRPLHGDRGTGRSTRISSDRVGTGSELPQEFVRAFFPNVLEQINALSARLGYPPLVQDSPSPMSKQY